MAKPVKNDAEVRTVNRVGVIEPGEPGKTAVSFNAVHRLSVKEYETYKNAVNELRAWATSDAYLLIRYSYQSLQQTMRRCAILYSQTPTPSNPHSVKLAINADFLNLLSHARLYLDHAETQLKRAQHGKKDEELAEFKRVTAHEYDNVFAYRFCYRLRNYALHCGFPITGFSAHSGFVQGTQKQEHSFEATFSTKTLLENFSEWGPQVKAELESKSEQLDLMEIASEYVAALEKVHKQMLKAYLPRLKSAAKTVQIMADHVKNENGHPHIFSLPPDETIKPQISNLNMTIEKIPLDLVASVEGIDSPDGKN